MLQDGGIVNVKHEVINFGDWWQHKTVTCTNHLTYATCSIQWIAVVLLQPRSSVIFTFLIPESVVNIFSDLDEDSQRDLADHGILRIEVNSKVIDLQWSERGQVD